MFLFPMSAQESPAIELLLREGRVARRKPRTHRHRGCRTVWRRWRRCRGRRCSTFPAIILLDDLVAVQRDGADVVLPERIAAVPDEERRLLHEALA
jgi:hypothetical protein